MIEQVLTDFAEDNGVSTPTVQNVLESDDETEGGCGVKGDRTVRAICAGWRWKVTTHLTTC